jgi:hypothetical protein
MRTDPTRRQFFLGLVTGLFGVATGWRFPTLVAPAAGPVVAAPLARCLPARLTLARDARNHTTTFLYDPRPGPLGSAAAPFGGSSAFRSDARGQPRA